MEPGTVAQWAAVGLALLSSSASLFFSFRTETRAAKVRRSERASSLGTAFAKIDGYLNNVVKSIPEGHCVASNWSPEVLERLWNDSNTIVGVVSGSLQAAAGSLLTIADKAYDIRQICEKNQSLLAAEGLKVLQDFYASLYLLSVSFATRKWFQGEAVTNEMISNDRYVSQFTKWHDEIRARRWVLRAGGQVLKPTGLPPAG